LNKIRGEDEHRKTAQATQNRDSNKHLHIVVHKYGNMYMIVRNKLTNSSDASTFGAGCTKLLYMHNSVAL
jgi:hypothetical protein